jgi:hypothetical protein
MRTDDFLADFEHVLHTAATRRLIRRAPRGRLLVAAGAVVAAVVLVAMLNRPAPTPSTPPADERPAPVVTPLPDPNPRFSVLDGPASEPLPGERTSDFQEDPIVRRLGVEWDEVHLATSGHDVDVYVAPAAARKDICVVTNSERFGTGLTCAEPTVQQRTVTTRFGLREGTLVAGIVPDGATEVEIDTPSASYSAPVRNNAFVVPINDDPATLRWRDAAGTHAQELAPSARSMPKPGTNR